MTLLYDLPCDLIGRQNANFWIEGQSSSVSGLGQRRPLVVTENRRWLGRVDFAAQEGVTLGRMKALGDQLNGRVNRLRIHVVNHGTTRFLGDVTAFYTALGVTESEIALGAISFDDGAFFDDGSGFALPDYNEPEVLVGGMIGATEIKVKGFLGEVLAVGAVFSDAQDYLYRVAQNHDGELTFNPPLRRSILPGERIEVSYPKVQMRLATDKDWRLFEDYCRFGKPMTVNFSEAFDR